MLSVSVVRPNKTRNEWAEGRRYLALDVLHRARLGPITTDTPDKETNQPLALSA